MADIDMTIGNHEIQQPRSLDQLKATYQTMIRFLLRQRGCEAISMPEFERFKHEARLSIFTCRLLSCPKSFVGFDNETSLIQHESGHCVHMCTFPGCYYPPFPSVASLRRHEKQQHEALSPPVPKRTSIRSTKPGTQNATDRVPTVDADAGHGSETPRSSPPIEPHPWEEEAAILDPEILFELPKWDVGFPIADIKSPDGLKLSVEEHSTMNAGIPRPSTPRPFVFDTNNPHQYASFA